MNEKYIPLYRKYRPQTLEEIVGQEHVKKALANAIDLNKISHAYLFTGPRGTGKTSSARILAKSLNCVDGPTVKPCGKCASCIDITNSTPLDVIEIDAASNRSVNDAQNILEKIQYAPVNGKYKIYIIDEVHMLTTEAFNALLKTLEEPPENVVFILATTEVHKVLDTIKSRCQRFDFKRISTNDIVNHLKHIAEIEKINIEDDAILTIAKNAAGGMRDSLAMLDQLSVLDTQSAITTEDINTLLGRLSFDVLNRLSNNIISSKANDAIETLEEIYNSGNEPTQILTNLLNYFKNMLIVKSCKTDLIMELTQTTDSQAKILKEQVKDLETQQIVFLLERTSHYINELKTATNQHIWLEIAMIDLSNMAENSKLSELQNRLLQLETGEVTPVAVSNYKTPPSPVQKPSMKPSGFSASVPPIAKPVEQPQTKPQSTFAVPQPTQKAEIKETVAEQKPQPQVEEKQQGENLVDVPMSTPTQVTTTDLTELWKNLLENVDNPLVRNLMAQQAKPLKISKDETILTSNDVWVKGLNSEGRFPSIQRAVDKLFSRTNCKIIIRLPQASDKELIQTTTTTPPKENVSKPSQPKTETNNEVAEKKEEVKPELEVKQEVKVDETSNIVYKETESPDMVEFVENETVVEKKNDVGLSDQAKMVKDLFNGIIIQ